MAALSVQSIDRFIGTGNPLAKAGGARMLLRATGGNLRGAAMLAALARKESSFGVAAFVPNNFWGYGIHAGPSVNRAPTVEAMASRVYKALVSPTGYYKTAKDPVQAIAIYAPSSENNTGLYQSQVSQWLTSMGANPKADFRGGPQSVGPPPANRPAPGAAPSSSVTPGGLPQLGGPAGQRLLDLLSTTTQGALRGEMPGPKFASGIGEIARGLSLPSPAQVIASTPTRPGPNAAAASAAAVGAPSKPQQAVKAAGKQVGQKYVWGGESRAEGGFDCSGLVQWAYAQVGIQLPRVTYDQVKRGRAINTRNQAAWQPGDLIFPHAGHVQIYLGNGMVREAPRTGLNVRDVPVRPGTPYAVRRIVG